MLFDFLSMANNYEERKIERYDKNGLFVDTCLVTDSDEPYETAIAHKRYDNGNIVIVEMYDTLKEAKNGHKKWIKKMLSKNLPKELKDVSTCEIAKLIRAIE